MLRRAYFVAELWLFHVAPSVVAITDPSCATTKHAVVVGQVIESNG
jgi:hypothetical protein